MIENEAPAGVSAAGAEPRPAVSCPRLPEFTLRAPPRLRRALDFSAPPIAVAPGPPPSGKLSRRLDAHGEFPPSAIPAPEMSLTSLSDLRPLGQIHESFIIAAGRDGLWIIDQHVAHERILFEQVLKQRAAGRVEMQRLLMPLILQLTPEQQIDYARIADELHASGFETEPFGNRTIAVKAAPAAVGAGRSGKDPLRDSGDRRERTARRLARRSAPQHLRLHRLPRRHQDQHAARCQQNGVAAARARRDRLPDELPARPAHRAALFHAGDPEGLPPDLKPLNLTAPILCQLRTGCGFCDAGIYRSTPGCLILLLDREISCTLTNY